MVSLRVVQGLFACYLLLALGSDPNCDGDKTEDTSTLLQSKFEVSDKSGQQEKSVVGDDGDDDDDEEGGGDGDDDEGNGGDDEGEGGGEESEGGSDEGEGGSEEGGEGADSSSGSAGGSDGGDNAATDADANEKYDAASDIFHSETTAEETVRLAGMMAKWNSRPSPKFLDFRAGDVLIMCLKTTDICPNGCDGSTVDSETDCELEHAKVLEVLGKGSVVIDYQDGITAMEIKDFGEPAVGVPEAIVSESVATKCTTAQFFMDVQGNPLDRGSKPNNPCVNECPPGFIAVKGSSLSGTSGAGGVCKPCYGRSTRRRRLSAEGVLVADGVADNCFACPAGHISNPSSDDCQNVQDMCNEEQCGPCSTCLASLRAPVSACATNSAEGCYNPGTMWCSGAQEAGMRCQSKSLGCFYKLVCKAQCVCSSWKANFCGGRVGNEPCVASTASAAMLLQSRNVSLSETQEASLDDSMSGKRTC